MVLVGIIVALLLCIFVPWVNFFRGPRDEKRFRKHLGANVISYFGALLLSVIVLFSGGAYAAEPAAAAAAVEGWRYIAAAISVGLGSVGAGIAVSASASAAIGAISENEGIFGKTIVFVGLAEGTAIYGLVIAFLILFAG